MCHASLRRRILLLGLCTALWLPYAAAERVQPFILASSEPADFTAKVQETGVKLQEAGFEILGQYQPYAQAEVIVVTNAALKSAAMASERGAYGAVARVAITQVGEQVEVSYTNPHYWANAYRLTANLLDVKQQFSTVLGAVKEYGTGDKRLSAADMREYHYTFMMEYFDDPSELGSFPSHAEAVAAIEKHLNSGKSASAMVYRLSLAQDSRGKPMTLVGVALKGKDAEDCSGDNYIMSRIDRSQPRHTAHLPYEILVYGQNVEALFARFRIAISWPHLPMIASETGATFFSIMCAPGAIEQTLRRIVAAPEKDDF